MRSNSILPLSVLALALCNCAPEGPSAFVDLNLAVSDECEVDLGGNPTLYIGVGTYDIRQGGVADSTFCRRDYLGRLRINSQLRSNAASLTGRAEPNILQVHRAEVTLKTQAGEIIEFIGDPPRPNPFAQVVNVSLFPTMDDSPSQGELQVPLIPASYDEFLPGFVNETIIAEVQLFGTTTGDVEVDFTPFPFPVRICDGCLTACAQEEFGGDESARETATEGVCDDNAGADGRICYDINC